MQQTILSTVILPLALALIMFGMGLSLKVADFKRVLEFPKAVAIGVFCQMVMLPLIGFGVVALFDIQSPAVAVGLVVLSLCPGGTTSNMLSHLAKGDVALSITLTAVVSVLTPFTIPLLTTVAMNRLMGAGKVIDMSFGKMIVILLAITIVPVAIGMAVHHKWPGFSKSADKPVKVLSMVFLFAIIGALVKRQSAELPGFFAQVGAAALTLNVVSMTLGFGAARIAGLTKRRQITIGMEVGIQNGTTALLVTGTLLDNTSMTIAPAVYSLIMFATGGLFGYLANRLPGDETSAPEAS